MTDLEAMKAAFLARGGAVTVAPAGVAYGVDAEARAMRAEHEAERHAERVREAYHVGGRSAAMDAYNR